MKTYLVTGGAGFIGSNFILYMLDKHKDIRIVNLDKLTYAGNLENLKPVEKDPRYRFVQGDICDQALLDGLFKEEHLDVVVNFAAESHVDRSILYPNVFEQTNVGGTVTLLNAAKNAWTEGEDVYRDGVRFHQVSTDEVYGALPLDRPDLLFTEGTPLDPHSPYAASKASADFFVKAYGDTYKLPVSITRCSNNYGPFQFPEKVIPLMINNALQHKSLPVYGDGMQVRDWLYVDDHCRAVDMVISQGKAGSVYNIGGHNERNNLTMVKTILGYLHNHVDNTIGEDLIRHVEDRKGHDQRYGIDPAKIQADLGWTPEIPFETGIQRAIQWYLDNREWMERVTSGTYQEYYKSVYEGRG